MALLDPVLHVATGAVEPLVEKGASASAGASEVRIKRGLSPSGSASALPITRRRRLQLSSVDHRKSLKRRAARPVARHSADASAISAAIAATRRSLRARPKT